MQHKSSKSSLFLMELILSIMFFSLAATVCVQLFVRSHVLSSKSVLLNHAVVSCESAAEIFIGLDSNIDDSVTYYDDSFEPVSDESSAKYKLSVSIDKDIPSTGLSTCHIAYINLENDEIVYSLNPVYYPKETKNEKE